MDGFGEKDARALRAQRAHEQKFRDATAHLVRRREENVADDSRGK
jgi:hypothetical protein